MESEENYETGRTVATESPSPLRYKQGKFYAGAEELIIRLTFFTLFKLHSAHPRYSIPIKPIHGESGREKGAAGVYYPAVIPFWF